VTRLTAAAMALVLSIAILAGCGDDDDTTDTVDAETYAGDVCSAIGGWLESILSGAQEATQLPPGTTPQEGKDFLVGFIDDALAETTATRDALEQAGVPDVEGGEETADALVSTFEEAVAVFEDASAETEALPTDSPQAFDEAATELGTTTQESLSQAGSALQELETSEELGTAAQDAPECQELASTTESS
jgi:hypothetical protein